MVENLDTITYFCANLAKISMKKPTNFLVLILVVLAIAARLLPHPANFTPIASIALLSGCYLSNKWLRFVMPLGALYLSDLFLNNVIYGEGTWNFGLNYSVYGAFVGIILIGTLLQNRTKINNIFIASLSGSLLFFLVTNFAAWLGMPGLYPANFTGLLAAYAAGIPFFGNTIAGDLIFTAVTFGLMYAALHAPKLFSVAK